MIHNYSYLIITEFLKIFLNSTCGVYLKTFIYYNIYLLLVNATSQIMFTDPESIAGVHKYYLPSHAELAIVVDTNL